MRVHEPHVCSKKNAFTGVKLCNNMIMIVISWKEAKMIVMVESRWHTTHIGSADVLWPFPFKNTNKIVRMEFLRTLSALIWRHTKNRQQLFWPTYGFHIHMIEHMWLHAQLGFWYFGITFKSSDLFISDPQNNTLLLVCLFLNFARR